MDDLLLELARIKARRAELRSAEFTLAKHAREVAARALGAPMPPALVAERLGYDLKVIQKWLKSPAPPVEMPRTHELRWAAAERAYGRKEERRQARLRRAKARGGRDGWRRRSLLSCPR